MLFSVIVTIYNKEKTLVKCLDSIRSQSFTDYEVLMIDDGSTDQSPQICDDYVNMDSRFRVLHKKNGGQLSARKSAVELGTGEYYVFADADDWLSKDYMKCVADIIRETGAEIIVCPICNEYEDGRPSELVKEPVPAGLYAGDDRKKIYEYMLVDEKLQHISYAGSVKVIEKGFYEKALLDSDSRTSVCEDTCVDIPIFLKAEKIYVSDQAPYHYLITDTSYCHGFRSRYIDEFILSVHYLEQIEGRENPYYKEQLDRYVCFILFNLIYAAAGDGETEAIKMMQQKILKDETIPAHLADARFGNLSIRDRIGYGLLKKGKIKELYDLIRLRKLL